MISGALTIKEVRSARIEKLEMLFYLEVLFVTINKLGTRAPESMLVHAERLHFEKSWHFNKYCSKLFFL
jgi:hypothetical protein